MSGTIEGGRKAAATNKAKYGEDFYKRNGAKGGRKSRTGGFFANPELARAAGKKGGSISKRGSELTIEEKQTIFQMYYKGASIAEMSEKTNRCYNTIKRYLKRVGVL